MADEYTTRIRGEQREDDGLRVELPVDPTDWWLTLQIGRCPDCGDLWVWSEAGHVPGTRECAGGPVGGEATSLMDIRVPQPGQYAEYDMIGPYAQRVIAHITELLVERNICSDARVEEIDRQVLALLLPWTRYQFRCERGLPQGCGSLFTVLGDRYDEDVGAGARRRRVAILRRERFYGGVR